MLRVGRMSFWVLYDHAGRFFLFNLVTVVPLALLVWLLANVFQLPVAAVAVVVALGAVAIAVIQVQIVDSVLSRDRRRPKTGAVRLFLAGFICGMIYLWLTASAVVGIGFYSRVAVQGHPIVGAALAQACACAGLFTVMTAFYMFPALHATGGALGPALRNAIALVVLHPVASGLFVLVGLALAIVAVIPPGPVLISAWPCAALSCSAYELLSRYHGDNAGDDSQDVYLNRGFRDFLFPWKE